ncbi:hypothetical protein Tco_0955270 [Tanacetum coccineum]|uniref:Uncharacterized protein n=1 Tax=Tanacetum coccineum TaxID=301880 RepID=A0ABQ5E6Q9_9ASTR
MPLDCQLGIVAMWGEWEGFVKWLMECCRVEVWEQNRVLAGFGIGGKKVYTSWVVTEGDVDSFKRCGTFNTFDVGYRVLKDLILHRSSINNSASLCNKFGGFYFSFKFGISGLLHHVVTVIADKIRELLEYMCVHNNDASESLKPSWSKMCTVMLQGQLSGGSSIVEATPKFQNLLKIRMLVWKEADSETLLKKESMKKAVPDLMHELENSEDIFSFGRLYFVVIVLVRNIFADLTKNNTLTGSVPGGWEFRGLKSVLIRRIQCPGYGVLVVSWSRDHAQIRRIFLDGYGVSVFRTVIFKYLRLGSRMRAF